MEERGVRSSGKVISGDLWKSGVCDPVVLVKHIVVRAPQITVYPIFSVVFLIFVFMTSFGLMNLMLGVICESAVYIASQNVESMQKVVLMHREMIINSITAIFEAADTDGSGELSKEEFDEAMAKKSVGGHFLKKNLMRPWQRNR